MNKKQNLNVAARPLSAAIFMALAAPMAVAGVTSTQLPGVGYVVSGSTVTSTVTTTTNTLDVKDLSGQTVIQWGGSKPGATAAPTVNATGTAGFDIGSSATVNFTGTGSVLNIDASGNPSTILGNLSAADASVFVANANGIVVGAGAVINTPSGLGLINANLNTTDAINAFTTGTGTILFSPSGASGGINIASGADLNQVGTFLDVAGAGNVNIDGGFVSQASGSSVVTVYNMPSTGTVNVVAGMAGTVDSAGTYTATNSASPAGTKVSLDSTTGVANLNLGTGTSPYAGLTQVVANGDINLAAGSNLTNVQSDTLEWTGTLTNDGIINFGSQTGSTLTTTTNEAYFASFASAGTTSPVLGSLVNASSGVINGGRLYFDGAAFSNTGTIQLGQSSKDSAPFLDIYATTGNINLAGTVSVVAAGSPAYTGALFLSKVYLSAASVANQSVMVDTNPLTVSSGFVQVSATNVNLSSSVNVTSGGSFYFSPYGSATPVSGAFTLANGATISAQNVYMGDGSTNPKAAPEIKLAQSAYNSALTAYDKDSSATNLSALNSAEAALSNAEASAKAYTSYMLNGGVVATGSTKAPGYATFGGTSLGQAAPFNIQGAGSITAGYLTINNLQGSVNNITTGQILANGFQLNAPSGGTMNIAVTADGAKSQGFNVNVNGNATINSGDTVAVGTQTPAANNQYAQYLYPANANSNLVVQASGALTVNAGGAANPYSINTATFQWPGLVYLQSNGGDLTSTTSIANAYGAQAQVGAAGVFMISKNITDNFPIYTNGNSGVVFAAPFDASVGTYGYASTINGVDPTTASTLPLVYFAQPNAQVGNANFSLQPLKTFTNENGNQQENQTFLTLAQTK